MPSDVNVYCDESRHSNQEDSHLVIGAVRCLRQDRRAVVAAITDLKCRHGIGGEFGWKRASWNKADFYLDVIDWFLECDELRFRCIVAEKSHLWSARAEDGFYVCYHQLLYHWFEPGHSYHVYLDRKGNSRPGRVSELRERTRASMACGAHLASMEEVESHECVPIQLSDLIVGCVGYVWCGHTDVREHAHASPFKALLAERLAHGLALPCLRTATPPDARKFNIFSFGA